MQMVNGLVGEQGMPSAPIYWTHHMQDLQLQQLELPLRVNVGNQEAGTKALAAAAARSTDEVAAAG
jgi:hypothetical protein